MSFIYQKIKETIFLYKPLPTSISQCKNLSRLGSGSSGIVYAMDSSRVVKQYTKPNETERLAFLRIGPHPHIVNYLGSLDDGSIILERGKPLRHVLDQDYDTISLSQKVRWLRDAAEAISYMHQKGVFYADIKCRNMILVGQQLKLIDLEGCTINIETDPSFCERFEVFAYGSAVYEVMTGRLPFQESAHGEDRYHRVPQHYEDNQLSDISGLVCGKLIEDCWNGNLRSMSEVIRELDSQTRGIYPLEKIEGSIGLVIWRKAQFAMRGLVSAIRQLWTGRTW